MNEIGRVPSSVAIDRQMPDQRPRDLRLDFFRGIGMFIIFVAHMPRNPWTLWIPARFGFSDATEIFVFCSGMASAIAFGSVFRSRGWAMGTGRVVYRVWQVYWAHIGLFLIIAALLTAINGLELTNRNYISSLNLQHFFKDPSTNLVGLLTLTYVPNYFDILPMYLGILMMLPIIMALARVNPSLAFGFVGIVWLLANLQILKLPAEPWSERTWFFNPFAWQLVFFSGFALISGWVKPPPINRRLIILAIVIILVTVPFAYFRLLNAFPDLRAVRDVIALLINKTNFGILRWVHFLAIAYLAWAAVGDGGRRLALEGRWAFVVQVIRRVGQQSLAVFLASLVAAQLLGVVLDLTGRNLATVAAANITGFAALIATAYVTGWFKRQPWRQPPKQAVGRNNPPISANQN